MHVVTSLVTIFPLHIVQIYYTDFTMSILFPLAEQKFSLVYCRSANQGKKNILEIYLVQGIYLKMLSNIGKEFYYFKKGTDTFARDATLSKCFASYSVGAGSGDFSPKRKNLFL